MSTLSSTELTKVRDAMARALSGDDVNQLGRDTGQAERLRTVTPHRLFLAIVSALASAHSIRSPTSSASGPLMMRALTPDRTRGTELGNEPTCYLKKLRSLPAEARSDRR